MLSDTTTETAATDAVAEPRAEASAPASARPWPQLEKSLVLALLAFGGLALLARVFVVTSSIGSNDMQTWTGFASRIYRRGVGELYDHVPLFNHPPLMGHFSSAAYALTKWTGIPFAWLFKTPMVLADLGAALLLYRGWRERGPIIAALVFAAYCANPVSILISAYHGNTDSLCASLILLSAVLMDRGRAFGAGLALAASINVKLIPVILIAPIGACVRDRKQALAYLGGLAIGALPFVPYLIWHWQGFYEHALAYRSRPKVWGITFLSARLATAPHVGEVGTAITDFWVKRGSLAVLGWPLLVAALRRLRGPRFSAREVATATVLGFLAFAPGFGIQYLVYPVALLFSVGLAPGLWYSAFAGLHAVVMYVTLWTGTRPFFSDFLGNQGTGRQMAVLSWLISVRLLFEVVLGERSEKVQKLAMRAPRTSDVSSLAQVARVLSWVRRRRA
jgi:hypothetical protein